MDWVANHESWGLDTPPYIADPNFSPGVDYSRALPMTSMLTYHKDLVDDIPEVGTPQLEQTAIRVVGDITFGTHMYVPGDMPTVNLRLWVNFRIGVSNQVPDTYFAPQVDTVPYNLDVAWVANDDFLWHARRETAISNRYWAVDASIDGNWVLPQHIDLDVRVQRRLRQQEVLVLYAQVSQGALIGAAGVLEYDPWPDLRVWVQPRLRTLVKTIT